MTSVTQKLIGITAVAVVAGVLIGFYITDYLMSGPPTFQPKATPGPTKNVNLTIQTVAAVGPALSPNPDWVSYLVLNKGKWERSTIWQVPAHSIVHVTVYQFDGKSGLRNPFMSRVRGTVGNMMTVNGKPLSVINPDDASHTFAIPALSLVVPLTGVGDNAPNQCGFAPCSLSNAHNTITFSFRVPGPGRYRWQCFVPCAAGWIYGFGGPMQTLGYMDGFVNVV